MIRLTVPSIEEDDLQAVRDVLLTGYLVQGRMVAAFERIVAEHVGSAWAVAVFNCTAALHLSLMALGIRSGDRVAVTTYSWPATANVIVLLGAQPVFIDIEPETFTMSPHALEQVLRQVEVKAILPVHAFGGMADLSRICAIADTHGVPVIEDAACALGAALYGKKAGAWGRMGCFSFHPRKAITTGEGGIITTDDADLARQLRILRNHGQDPDASVPDFVAAGLNYRLTEFQAAMGCTQLAKLSRVIAARQARASLYDRLLEGTGMTAPVVREDSFHVYQSYVILLPQAVRERRDAIIRSLKEQGVEVTIGTYHMPLTRFFRTQGGYQPGDFPVTDDIAARAVSLPLHEYLTDEEQRHVVSLLKRAVEAEGSAVR